MSALMFLILILAVVPDIESYSNQGKYNGSNTTALARFTENKKFERALPLFSDNTEYERALPLFSDNTEYERKENGYPCSSQGGLCSVGRRCCKLLTCRTEGHFKDRCAKTDCRIFASSCKAEGDCCGELKCLDLNWGSLMCWFHNDCTKFKDPCNDDTQKCCGSLYCIRTANKVKCDLPAHISGTITLSPLTCIAVLVSSWTFKFVLV